MRVKLRLVTMRIVPSPQTSVMRHCMISMLRWGGEGGGKRGRRRRRRRRRTGKH